MTSDQNEMTFQRNAMAFFKRRFLFSELALDHNDFQKVSFYYYKIWHGLQRQ